MLYEITRIRQSDRHLKKRWFTSTDMDLTLWLHEGMPMSFQLSYNKGSHEKAIVWNQDRGFQHYAIVSGERYPEQYRQSAILLDACDHLELITIARNFLAASEKIEIGISDFIYARLMAYPDPKLLHSASRTDLSSLR